MSFILKKNIHVYTEEHLLLILKHTLTHQDHRVQSYDLGLGDVTVWRSWERHRVQPLTGHRHVLAVQVRGSDRLKYRLKYKLEYRLEESK